MCSTLAARLGRLQISPNILGFNPSFRCLSVFTVHSHDTSDKLQIMKQSKRHRQRKILTWPVDYLPFKFTYPPKMDVVKESGDSVTKIPDVDPMAPRGIFRHSTELEKAPEVVKRLLSVSYGTRAELTRTLREDFLDRVRRFPGDNHSLEYRIADRTFVSRSLQEVYFDGLMTRNKSMKVRLHEAIKMRNKLLNKLRKLDQERYEFVLEKLEIIHQPAPLGTPVIKKTRKGELRRLTAEYCENVKQKKLASFHAALKKEQEVFSKEQKEFEEWLRKEETELKLTQEEKASTDYVSFLKKSA